MHRFIVRLALLGLVGVAAGACGSTTATPKASDGAVAAPSSGVPSGGVTITARDSSYDLPPTLVAGINQLTLTNVGSSLHEFRFLHLQGPATADDVKSAVMARDRARIATLAESDGGTSVNPGQSARMALDLKPGSYVVTSTETAGGAPDIAKGMLATFTVNAGPSPASAPAAKGTLTMRDSAYELPAGYGRGVYRVVNNGTTVHEARVFRVEAGKSLDDVRAALGNRGAEPPAWLQDVFEAGVLDLSPGVDAWLTLDLPPAHYALVSFVADPQTHAPQFSQGMIADFSVA